MFGLVIPEKGKQFTLSVKCIFSVGTDQKKKNCKRGFTYIKLKVDKLYVLCDASDTELNITLLYARLRFT